MTPQQPRYVSIADVVDIAQELAHNHEEYARHLAVYLGRKVKNGSRRGKYIRIFPDHGKVTAYSDGKHSPIFELTQRGLYFAARFAKQGKVDEPTTIISDNHQNAVLIEIMEAIERGFHSQNEREQMSTEPSGRGALEERV